MNIAEFAIKKHVITWVLTFLTAVGGIVAYDTIGRLEDPEFTIKDALVVTAYPGASAREVEQEVTNEIEKAIQLLGQVEKVRSKSERGLSTVTVTIKDKFDKATLPQVWDELRRKISDAESKLPPGSGTPLVVDDYGDVFGIFLAVTGDGYSYEEIRRYVDMLQSELLLVEDVKRVDIYGLHDETVYVEISREKMASLGISSQHIYNLLSSRNLVVNSGYVQAGSEYIPIKTTGEYSSVEQIGELLINAGSSDELIYLKDISEIKRGYRQPASLYFRYDGNPALGLAISTVTGGNVVSMGEALERRLKEIESSRPVGMELAKVAYQSEAVTEAIGSFVVSLIQAVAIVVAVLLIFMGLRSGLIMGFVLLLTIMATLVVMKSSGVLLERISLGALIIALGMLVDNAIVITEGMLIKVQQGGAKLEAARDVISQNMMPLLGATVVAVTAFGAIGLSQDSTGEYCRSLFLVLLYSLMASWLIAITVTPLLCYTFLKAPKKEQKASKSDPYGGACYMMYKKFLCVCVGPLGRWITVGVVLVMLLAAGFGFGFIENSFFPQSTRKQFMVDVWLPMDTHIDETEKVVGEIEQHVLGLDNVTSVASCIGKGAPRFLLVYAPEKSDSGYAQLLVSVDDYHVIDDMKRRLQEYLDNRYVDAECLVKKFLLGPGEGGKIQLRFRGRDLEVLRELADNAQAIFENDGGGAGIYNDWRQKVKVVRAEVLEDRARRAGVTRPEIARVLSVAFEGTQVGVYRERDRLLPIVVRASEQERDDVTKITDQQIWSPAAQRMIPLTQVVSSNFQTIWENQIIQRRNRVPTITIHCDQKKGNASVLLDRVRPKVEKMYQDYYRENKLGVNYSLEWGGEYEDSKDAKAALAGSLPGFLIFMVLVVICLFNSLRQPLIIYLCVPLAIIGVTVGLLATGQPFGFMPLLGLLSLSGMLIKNAIVLIDQIEINIKSDQPRFAAVLDAAVSRMRPVMMATVTTVLGMMPLLKDAFYISMAVTIMFGLSFAAVLTLIVVPAFYAIFFRIKTTEV